MTYSAAEAQNLFAQIPEVEESRRREISAMCEPYIAVTDRYACLAARLTFMLGHVPPRDTQDRVIRDLFADVFDFLYESRSLIICGKLGVAYPLARRAYESLSLLHIFCLDAAVAEKWEGRKKIGNAEVRTRLAKHPMGESEAFLRELYAFFSTASHPNRVMIPYRYLGEGNEFPLGVRLLPELSLIADYSGKNLLLWHWLVATTSRFFEHIIKPVDTEYADEYMACRKQAISVQKLISEATQRLVKKRVAMDRSEGRLPDG